MGPTPQYPCVKVEEFGGHWRVRVDWSEERRLSFDPLTALELGWALVQAGDDAVTRASRDVLAEVLDDGQKKGEADD